MRDRTTNRRRAAGGFTLLEVVLALAILAIGLGVLTEVSRMSRTSALRATRDTESSLVAESVMALLEAGAIELANISETDWDPVSSLEPQWRYTVTVEQTAVVGLLMVYVEVLENDAGDLEPANFRLARWFQDPAVIEEIESEAAAAAEQEQTTTQESM